MLEKKVESFLRQKDVCLNNCNVLVGVSGGPDSLALLHLLWMQQEKWNITVFAAHIDHMFRGEESLQEALFVKRFCEIRDIPFEMAQIDVPNYIEKSGLSSQNAARECRYQFFKEIIDQKDIQYLMLGHHGDDQIETMLMRLTRGSTGKARAGIPFLRPFHKGFIIRPFLCLNRSEIEEYCSYYNLEPRRDPSNDKPIYSRNRFRLEVLPFLQKENPKVHEHFQRFSEDIQQDEDFLQELTVQRMKTVLMEKEQDKVTINIPSLLTLPMPLQRRGIQLILNYLYKENTSSLTAIHIEQIFSLISSSHPSGYIDLPKGLKIVRSYEKCHFQYQSEEAQPYWLEISKPGSYTLPNGDEIVMEFKNEGYFEKDLNKILINMNDSLPIVIRTRKIGDRMTLRGMKGTKKIKDIFIDQKVPVQARNQWPVVTDKNDQVLWIPGIKKANDTYSSNSNSSYILLKYIKH